MRSPQAMTHEETGFVEAIHADPQDTTAWRVWHDYLLECDDPRVDFVRFQLLRRGIEVGVAPAEVERRVRELIEAGHEPATAILTNSLGMEFALIPAGKCIMGSPEDEADRSGDERQHEVEITNPFYLGIYQVTQEQFQRIMRSNPSHFKGQANLPVDSATWNEAVDFCRRLSELADEKNHGRMCRLPTEAEWEYSCRGGASEYQPFHHGKSLFSTQANFHGDYPYGGAAKAPNLMKTTPVGSYKPNAWGLYDMHGNVWEWCSDWYDANYYNKNPRQNPQSSQNGNGRVLRGGSWSDDGFGCRAASRNDDDPVTRNYLYGFRVVLTFA